MHFVSLCFLNERIITTSLLMINLKCTVALNSSFIEKPFLSCGRFNMLFRFFRFIIYFNEAFVKKFMKKLSFFDTNFKNSFQDVLYYRKLGCQIL